MMEEKIVYGLHLPANAVVKAIKRTRDLREIIAMTMECNGIAVTFFRTDFLPELAELKPIPWDTCERFDEGWFHEEMPEAFTESIKNQRGIFIARDFVENSSAMNIGMAKELTEAHEIPGMEATLTFGSIYDMMGRWLIATGMLTETEWLYPPESKKEKDDILDRDYNCSTIRELFGDIFEPEWTQEHYKNCAIIRGGEQHSDGEGLYPARKRYTYYDWMMVPKAKARPMWFFKL